MDPWSYSHSKGLNIFSHRNYSKCTQKNDFCIVFVKFIPKNLGLATFRMHRIELNKYEISDRTRTIKYSECTKKRFLYCFHVFDTFCGLIDIRCGNALIHGAFDLFCSCLFKFMSCTFKPQKCQTQPKLSNRIKRILNPFILPSSLLKPFSICQIKEKIFITICIKWVLD